VSTVLITCNKHQLQISKQGCTITIVSKLTVLRTQTVGLGSQNGRKDHFEIDAVVLCEALGNPSCLELVDKTVGLELDLEEPLGFDHVVATQSWYKGVDAVLLD
jgi:hypothetical protein